MPHYDFEDPAGKPVEVWMTMSEAPLIGETMDLGGVTLTRVVSQRPSRGAVQRSIDCAIVHQAEPWAPGAKHYVMDRSSPNFGQPVMTTRKEVADFLRENPGGSYGEGLSHID